MRHADWTRTIGASNAIPILLDTLRVRLDSDVAIAEFAGDFHTQVFRSDSQFPVAVPACGVKRFRPDARAGEVDLELAAAMFARHADARVFSIDTQLFRAVRTDQVITCDFDVDHVVDLLQLKERRDFHVAAIQVRIQECSTELTVDQIGRHILSAIGAGTAGPGGHD